MTPREAADALAAGALALDVREDDEWDAAHIAGALHLRLSELGVRYEELAREVPIVCVCRSGGRSAAAATALAGAGYTTYNLEGGMKAWLADGLPIEPADGHVA